jgi:DinB superfamily
MHARIQELLHYLDDTVADLRAAVDSVPSALRERKPAPGRWSVAEVLEHLSLVEERIAKMAAAQIESGRADGLGPDPNTVGALETFDAHRVVDRSRRMIASENALPFQGLDEPAAWAALSQARAAVRTAVLGGDGMNLAELVVPHSTLGHMNLYHWVAFIGAHELRHAAQIREIAAQLSK